MMHMADPIASLLSLARSPSVEDALGPWLDMTPEEADAYAGDPATQDGLDPARLHGLLLILAARLPDPRHAVLIAALVHRCAPVASDVEDLRTAMHLLSIWRSSIDDASFARIIDAKHASECVWNALSMAGMNPNEEESQRLHDAMDDLQDLDHAVVGLGKHDMVVEMASDRWIVGILSEGQLRIMDVIPYGGRGNGPDDGDEPSPDPMPRLLIDA